MDKHIVAQRLKMIIETFITVELLIITVLLSNWSLVLCLFYSCLLMFMLIYSV
jgi:hypothetical protein